MKPELHLVGTKELKNDLSAWLKVVERGGRVLVTNRGRVIGELCRPLAGPQAAGERSLLRQWVEEARVRPAHPRSAMSASPLRLPEGLAAQLLAEERAE